MKYTDLQDKSSAELKELLKEKKVLLFTLRQKLKTMQLTNPNEIREVRRDIARISTAISAQNKWLGESNGFKKRNTRCSCTKNWW